MFYLFNEDKKIDLVFILLLIEISILAIDFLLNSSHKKLIENISKYPVFQDLGSSMIITFLIALIGNLSPIPTPYTFVYVFHKVRFII